MQASSEFCRVNVFREVDDGMYFDWYRLATVEEVAATGLYIIVEERIPEDVLWARLGAD